MDAKWNSAKARYDRNQETQEDRDILSGAAGPNEKPFPIMQRLSYPLSDRMFRAAGYLQVNKTPEIAQIGADLEGWANEVVALEDERAALASRVAELEKVRDLLAQRTQFEAAWRIANEECHDYGLACYMLRDLELTRQNMELHDLLWAIHEGGCAKGDWELVRDLWDKAYRETIVALRSADEAQLARDNAKETC